MINKHWWSWTYLTWNVACYLKNLWINCSQKLPEHLWWNSGGFELSFCWQPEQFVPEVSVKIIFDEVLRTDLGKVRSERILPQAGIDPLLSQFRVFGKSMIGYTLTLGTVTYSHCTHGMVTAAVWVRHRRNLNPVKIWFGGSLFESDGFFWSDFILKGI